ncbi:MAG: UDP-N-acetylmuramoyl-L-alanine--D-glutamate ligase [Phycisphaerales bacterium]|nr:UDP-N-acetylmuramoyl-L-alanine--D-glutamate ligase [Planctomycetota bacterium]MCH8507929.1 UDP-N-acetylmuramoyl-L-alanine--D-glutamate ligase [Phycisphaerales bacterium]
MESFEGRRVVVMGLGRFGGGVGVTRWLAERGADVLVTDKEPGERLEDSVAKIKDLVAGGRVQLRLGEHRVNDFTTADLVVVNPAVPKPWDDRFVRSAQAAGIELTTEIGLVAKLIGRERVVGVTGSAGKSTTCAMIDHALRSCGVDCVLGGNIGGSLLEQAGRIGKKTVVVLEVSSAMLYWLGIEEWSPRIAVVTNLEPNHLDWHGNESHYRESKQKILADQRAGDAAVLGEGVARWPVGAAVDRTIVGADEGVAGCLVPGAHNAWNARLAVVAARLAAQRIAGVSLDASRLEAAVRSFPGLPHRLRLVHEAGGVRFYDDSKSTVPRACVLAVDALDHTLGPESVHLICGGYDKKVDLSAISGLGGRVQGLYTIGATGEAIAAGAGDRAVRCGTLDVAVREAAARAKPGHAVLLSPGCASWDQFEHFEARGRAFEDFARRATESVVR